MKERKKYLKFSFLTDIRGMKNAIGEMRGIGFPKQPSLNQKKYNERAQQNGPNLYDEKWFQTTITDKVQSHPGNAMDGPKLYGKRIFDAPVIGFIPGNHPLFAQYKEIIGPHHLTPFDIMEWQAKQNGISAPPAEDLSVVSFILPIAEHTRKSNALMDKFPSEAWAQTRLLGEIFAQTFVREIVTDLMANGILAVAPDVTLFFKKQRYPRIGWGSPWSHRHMAYAAGLGTFGMHDFLITEKGAAHRCGSFVVQLKLHSNRQIPSDIHKNCLQWQGKACLHCAKRCPAGAISEKGHDKEKCYQYVSQTLKYVNRKYHIFIYGCGLCAAGVPCEYHDPI